VALVTPWRPDQSGIAEYNLRLASELGLRVDVDVVVSGSREEYPTPRENGLQLVANRDFEWLRAIRQYDRVVYCMGNSRFHRHVYELIRRRPGAVVLHDVQLTGFYGWYAGIERPEAPGQRLAERIGALYGARIPAETTSDLFPSWDRLEALGIYMTRELQSYAEQCFVHSQLACDVLELDRQPLDRSVPVSVLPFGMPEPAAKARGAASPAPTVISLGHVHEVKGLATLISAFGLLCTNVPNARLVIAGPSDHVETERWNSYAAEHAPGADMSLTGHLSSERYAELLRKADLAVQLRLVSNGEASAAVADCLAAGLPTIVTDVGWTGELPPSAVKSVPVAVEPAELSARMLQLLTDPGDREVISQAALDHARSFSFARVADAYMDALELRR
jgi:glycosyltransferase involved in cell wall biosynthesis